MPQIEGRKVSRKAHTNVLGQHLDLIVAYDQVAELGEVCLAERNEGKGVVFVIIERDMLEPRERFHKPFRKLLESVFVQPHFCHTFRPAIVIVAAAR